MDALSLPTRHAWSSVTDAVQPMSLTDNSAADLLAREEVAVRRIIARYVRHATIVDDLFQEISLKVMRRVDSVRDPQAIRGWLFQLSRNACLDWLRAQERRPVTVTSELVQLDAGGDLGRNPLDHIICSERIQAVHRALAQLPDSQREVIRLRIEDGLDHEAIAERLGISRQAVEVRLCRGRAKLKEHLTAIAEGDL